MWRWRTRASTIRPSGSNGDANATWSVILVPYAVFSKQCCVANTQLGRAASRRQRCAVCWYSTIIDVIRQRTPKSVAQVTSRQGSCAFADAFDDTLAGEAARCTPTSGERSKQGSARRDVRDEVDVSHVSRSSKKRRFGAQ